MALDINTVMRPSFKQVEANKLSALRTGILLDQEPCISTGVAVGTYNSYSVLENGIIVGLSTNGFIENYDPLKHGDIFVVYDDVLVDGVYDGRDQYAQIFASVTDKLYPRCCKLSVGDVFTTDNFTGTLATGYGKVTSGRITMQAAADADTLFIVTKTTLPDGKAAAECKFVGKHEVEAGA